jgi:hypothetical protein
MSAAILEQTPLRAAAARAGGINPLCRELGVTRQSFYDWEKQAGATPIYALLIARLTGLDHFTVCAERYHDQLVAVADYFARR